MSQLMLAVHLTGHSMNHHESQIVDVLPVMVHLGLYEWNKMQQDGTSAKIPLG